MLKKKRVCDVCKKEIANISEGSAVIIKDMAGVNIFKGMTVHNVNCDRTLSKWAAENALSSSANWGFSSFSSDEELDNYLLTGETYWGI